MKTDRQGNEHSLLRTFQGCFLPNFDSFGLAVTEEKIFQKSTNQKQELPLEAMFVNGFGRNQHSLQRTFQGCLLPTFDSFGKAVLEQTIFQKSTNQKQELSVAAMFVNASELNEHIENLPRMLPTKFRFIWPNGFRGEDFLEIN